MIFFLSTTRRGSLCSKGVAYAQAPSPLGIRLTEDVNTRHLFLFMEKIHMSVICVFSHIICFKEISSKHKGDLLK